MSGSSFPARRWRARSVSKITRGPKDYNKLKADSTAAGYKGEKVVMLAASTIPTIWAEAQVASDVLKKIGIQRRLPGAGMGHGGAAPRQPRADRQGRLEHFLYVSRRLRERFAGARPLRSRATASTALVRLADRSEDGGAAPGVVRRAGYGGAEEDLRADAGASSGRTRLMRRWACTTSRPAFHNYLTDIPDGWPQFYGVKKNA